MSAPVEWWEQAACKGRLGLFFPNPAETRGEAFARVAAARALCASCPVIGPCRAEGMAVHDGIWGGLTEEERSRRRGSDARLSADGQMRVRPGRDLKTHCGRCGGELRRRPNGRPWCPPCHAEEQRVWKAKRVAS